MTETLTDSEVATLRERIQRLEDQSQIFQIFSKYSWSADYLQEDVYADVFADDGTFEVHAVSGKPLHREDGTEELLRYMLSNDRRATFDKHLLAQPVIVEQTEDEATVESFFIALKDVGNGPEIGSYGKYYDHVVKVDGKWRIKHRRAEVEAPRMA